MIDFTSSVTKGNANCILTCSLFVSPGGDNSYVLENTGSPYNNAFISSWEPTNSNNDLKVYTVDKATYDPENAVPLVFDMRVICTDTLSFSPDNTVQWDFQQTFND